MIILYSESNKPHKQQQQTGGFNMLDFRTCKFSELLNLYIELNKLNYKTPKQVKLFKAVKGFLNDRFRYHFTLYLYTGEIVGDEVRDSDLHNRALTAYVLQGAAKIGRQKVYINYDKPIGERCRYVSEYGIQAVTDEQIDFDKALDRIYH
jgi:hypothetical protein